ncbi:arsenate reductase family protein [Litorimonas sp. RW-G-Af-16]
MKVYHLKTCDTCRKAIKALQAAGHDPELIDV